MDSGGNWLIAANQDSDTLSVFSRDAASGKLNFLHQEYAATVAFREKPKSFSHKLQKSTTFCKLAKNKRAFERYFISYQTPFYLFIIMAHPVCIPVYLKYHNSMPYKFGQDDSG